MSPQLSLDLIPPRPVITEPAPAIAPIAMSPAPEPPLPPSALPEPIAVREQAPLIQPAPILGSASPQAPHLIQETVTQPAKPTSVSISFGRDTQLPEPPAPAPLRLQTETLDSASVAAAKKTPEASEIPPLPSTFFESVGSIDFADADIEPVEPASDWRWQGSKILLPLDRPLPKIEGQIAQASPVTPVQELGDVANASVSEQLRETVTPATVAQAYYGRNQALIPELAKMTGESVTAPAQTPQTVATPIASPAQQVVAQPNPPAAMPQSTPTTPQPTPAAAPIPLPASIAVPPAQPVAAPQPAPAVAPVSVATPPVQPVQPASAVATPTVQPAPAVALAPVTVLSHTATGPAPVAGAFIRDEALDIDDTEEDDYYRDEDEGEDEGKGSYSGPRFILLLIIILVLEMFFVLLLVNMGVIDPAAIADFWGGLLS